MKIFNRTRTKELQLSDVNLDICPVMHPLAVF